MLESVKGFDEVLICDMHSTDSTLDLAKKYGCRIVFCEKHPFVEPVRQFAIDSATYEWVLLVDSDEVVPVALADYLRKIIAEPNPPSGIWIPRKNYVMGRFMHGDYPDYILRFFRKTGVVWPSFVHAVPKISGKVKRIPKSRKDLAFIHLINNSVELRLSKINTYSNNEVHKRAGQSFPLLKAFYAPFFRFFRAYVLKGGFRDGKAGFVNASLGAIYKFATIAKIWESRVNADDWDDELKS